MIKKTKSQNGFTLVELMIATTVFSTILVIASTAMITIGRYYQKGVTSARAQGAARDIQEIISEKIRFGGKFPVQTLPPPPTPGTPSIGAICIEANRFTYAIDAQVDSSVTFDAAKELIKHGVWQDTAIHPELCTPVDLTIDNPSTTAGNAEGKNGKEILPANMRLSEFKVFNVTGDLYVINLGIAYGDYDLFERDPVTNTITGCKSSRFGGSFCGISKLNTSVQRRVK